jgi:hypothetical protein
MWRQVKMAVPLAVLWIQLGCSSAPVTNGEPGWSSTVRESSLITFQEGSGEAPPALFTGDVPVVFTLEADFRQLKRDRDQESEDRPATMTLKQGLGEELSIPLQLRTRGNFRLQRHICPFPPLRLNFPEDSVGGTLFEGQDKLKLVTHCMDRDRYELNVLEEYLAYRIFNLLSDISFRVQLALITYRDSGGRESPVSRIGFLIEDEDLMAARLEGKMVEVPAADPNDFAQGQAGLMYLFQYLIGNTDWSGAGFHNVKLIQVGWDFLPVPYDFDFSGLVDAPYAGPNPALARQIETVRERLYRGFCSDEIDYDAVFARFNEKREAILELVDNLPGYTGRTARLTRNYIEEFFETINDSHEADWEIKSRCRRSG